MAEYIEREALLKHLCNSCDGWCENTNCDCVNCKSDRRCDIVIEVSGVPTADVAPVVHGRWIKTDRGMHEDVNTGAVIRFYLHDCSVCGWHTGNQGRNFSYCPNCGADMREADHEVT